MTARTIILNALDKQAATAGIIARQTSLSYAAVIHHLRLLETEGVVSRQGNKPYSWLLTGLGQKRLVS
jgi:predicted transcriptional regulator